MRILSNHFINHFLDYLQQDLNDRLIILSKMKNEKSITLKQFREDKKLTHQWLSCIKWARIKHREDY